MRSLWLTYHDLHEGGPRPGVPLSASRYHIPVEIFRRHLEIVEASGLRVLTAGESLKWDDGDSVVLTFDDGWIGALTEGVRLLREKGWRATLYLTWDFLGQQNFMGREMVREAAGAGMEIGMHTVSHRMLTSCTRDEIKREFRRSRMWLEDLTGQEVILGSVPGGASGPLVERVAIESGLRSLCSSRPGINSPGTSPFRLHRITIRHDTTAEAVERLCRFQVGPETVRWMLFEIPHRILGMRAYSKLRRKLLGDREYELFKP